MNIDLDFNQLANQFRGLNPNDPGSWPLMPRLAVLLALFVFVLVLGYYAFLGQRDTQLATLQAEEKTLRAGFEEKYAKAANLEVFKKQKELVNQYVVTIERQLPSKAEMDALLSDINQAGTGRGLQFDLFKPGQVAIRDYYAELPIELIVTGNYHDIASFASDLSNMPRIVTLNSMDIHPKDKDANSLELKAIAKTFRYLDPEEVLAARNAAAKKK